MGRRFRPVDRRAIGRANPFVRPLRRAPAARASRPRGRRAFAAIVVCEKSQHRGVAGALVAVHESPWRRVHDEIILADAGRIRNRVGPRTRRQRDILVLDDGQGRRTGRHRHGGSRLEGGRNRRGARRGSRVSELLVAHHFGRWRDGAHDADCRGPAARASPRRRGAPADRAQTSVARRSRRQPTGSFTSRRGYYALEANGDTSTREET